MARWRHGKAVGGKGERQQFREETEQTQRQEQDAQDRDAYLRQRLRYEQEQKNDPFREWIHKRR